jgi:hypothetical protein
MVTEDPGRRGVAIKARAPRNRDPREAEAGPRVMSGGGVQVAEHSGESVQLA